DIDHYTLSLHDALPIWTNKYTLLSDEQKEQVEFVQFHPSYDYSDFVEGLRPKTTDDGSIGFKRQDGIFTQFVAKAQKNYDNSQRSEEHTSELQSRFDLV